MFKFTILILGLLLCANSASAQETAPIFEISSPKMLPSSPGRITSEGYLAVDPSDSSHLVAAYLSAKIVENGVDYHTEAIETFDKGASWSPLSLTILAEAADPWCAIQPDGSVLVMDISEGGKYVLSTRIKKVGESNWLTLKSYGNGFDHGMIIQQAGSVNMVALATQQVTSNGSMGNALMVDFAPMVEGSQVHHISPFGNVGFNAKNAVYDGIGYWYIPILVRDKVVAGEFERMPHIQLWLIKIDEEGNLVDGPNFITDRADNRHHWLVPSGSGQLHLLYTAQNKSGIYHQMSPDSGKTWNKENRINGIDTSWSDLAAAACNLDGHIVVVWTEQMDNGCYQKYISVSDQTGTNWFAPKPLHDIPSCPDSTNGWVKRAWPQGGDYCGLKAISNKEFMAIWSGAQSGKFKLYQTLIKLK